MTILKGNKSLSTISVYFIILSLIVGSLFFLRTGYVVGMLGFSGAVFMILVGAVVIIPASLSIAELATNQKVEGEGQYYIISRTYGLRIGAVIGMLLYLVQTISIAFYIVLFTEAFLPLLQLIGLDGIWGRPIVSILTFIVLITLISKKKQLFKLSYLMIVILVIFIALLMLFMANHEAEELYGAGFFSMHTGNISDSFMVVFGSFFPSLACIIAGIAITKPVSRQYSKIPKAIIMAIFTCLIIFCIAAYKLGKAALPADLIDDQFVMSRIALFGSFIIPVAIASTAYIAASLFIMLAPHTLNGLATDGVLPIKGLNKILTPDTEKQGKIFNVNFITYFIVFFIILKGEIDYTAKILSILYLLFFASICFCAFLNDFGADPSYRPAFRSRWYVSLTGFLVSILLLILLRPFYAFLSIILIIIVYQMVKPMQGVKKDFANLVQGALFQLNRYIQLYFQKKLKEELVFGWSPAVVCATSLTFQSDKALKIMKWISYRYGYGSYIHLIEDNVLGNTVTVTREVLNKLKDLAGIDNRVYLNALVTNSYHSSLSQIIQLPVVPGKANNMVLLVYEKDSVNGFQKLIDGVSLANTANTDVAILIPSEKFISFFNGIHVWLDSKSMLNFELMLNLSYIIMAHPDWKDGKIKIFDIVHEGSADEERARLNKLGSLGTLPLSANNIEIVEMRENSDPINVIVLNSLKAGLIILGFDDKMLQSEKLNIGRFADFGDILYLKATEIKDFS